MVTRTRTNINAVYGIYMQKQEPYYLLRFFQDSIICDVTSFS